MKRHKNKLRRKLETFGILVMLLASTGLMSQLIINVLFMNKNNVVMAYSREITKSRKTFHRMFFGFFFFVLALEPSHSRPQWCTNGSSLKNIQ